MLTPGERIILERLLELHPSDKAFDLFEMMRSEKRIDESGALHVQNFSANELPEITLTREISGTVYTVTGSYDGIGPLDRKLERVMEQNATCAEAEA